MLFNSYLFIFIFLPISLLGYYLLGEVNRRYAAVWLCLVSVVFYGWWNPGFVGLLLISIAFNYAVSLIVGSTLRSAKARDMVLISGVAGNLVLLCYYKYFVSIVGTLVDWGLALSRPDEILLPLGISFFTFTQIGYLLDCRAGVVKNPNLLSHFLFVTFFPHLIAGPVLHHKEMMPQFENPENYRFKFENISVGFAVFIMGLAKKVVFADAIAPYADSGFSNPNALQFWAGWGTSLAYALQLYFDFSGYSDMAMGLAKMFGVRFPLNFNSPFKSTSIIEFWGRWHMTLSRYLTAYLYYPLAMRVSRWWSKRGHPIGSVGARRPRGFLLMIALPTIYTMGLAGVWHGAGLQYFIYGMLHGLYLTVNHAWRIWLAPRWAPQGLMGKKFWAVFCVALTFFAVVIAHAFFRADNASDAVALIHAMLGFNGVEGLDPSLSLWLSGEMQWRNVIGRHLLILELLGLSLIVWLAPNSHQIMGRYSPALAKAQEAAVSWMRWRPNAYWLCVSLALLIFSLARLQRETRFLYFQF